jgi:hypothetical protein
MELTKPDAEERRSAHIRELRETLEKHCPGFAWQNSSCSPEIEEQFLEHVLAFEDADPTVPFDELVKSGLQLPAPDEMDDAVLNAKLWEVVRGMSLLGCYLHNTDHLSDRELYGQLWYEILQEPTTLIPQNLNFACHIDIIGGGSEDDLQVYLKYYADAEAREHWPVDFPDDPIPAHENPPFDRDRYLPSPPEHYQKKLIE